MVTPGAAAATYRNRSLVDGFGGRTEPPGLCVGILSEGWGTFELAAGGRDSGSVSYIRHYVFRAAINLKVDRLLLWWRKRFCL
jgi:hypothetical protein